MFAIYLKLRYYPRCDLMLYEYLRYRLFCCLFYMGTAQGLAGQRILLEFSSRGVKVRRSARNRNLAKSLNIYPDLRDLLPTNVEIR